MKHRKPGRYGDKCISVLKLNAFKMVCRYFFKKTDIGYRAVVLETVAQFRYKLFKTTQFN